MSPFSGLSPGRGGAVASVYCLQCLYLISTVASVYSVYCLAGAALIFIQTQGDAAMYYAPRVTAATVWQAVHIVILPRVAVAVHAVDLLLEGARPPAQEPVRGARGGEARARHDERALQLGVQPAGGGV